MKNVVLIMLMPIELIVSDTIWL